MQNLTLFFKILKLIGAFYKLCDQPENAMKFYRQLLIAASLQKNYSYVSQALIGLSSCCDGENLLQ